MKDVSMPLDLNILLPFVVLIVLYAIFHRKAVRRGELPKRDSGVYIRNIALVLLMVAVFSAVLSKQNPDTYNTLFVAVQAAAPPILVAWAIRQLRRVGWRLRRGMWNWVLFILALLAVYELFKLFKKTSDNQQLLVWMVTGLAVGVLLVIVRWRFLFGDAPARMNGEASR